MIFARADLRDTDSSRKERSKLAAKVMNFGGKELKKEWRKRASETDLMRYLEREGTWSGGTSRDCQAPVGEGL